MKTEIDCLKSVMNSRPDTVFTYSLPNVKELFELRKEQFSPKFYCLGIRWYISFEVNLKKDNDISDYLGNFILLLLLHFI